MDSLVSAVKSLIEVDEPLTFTFQSSASTPTPLTAPQRQTLLTHLATALNNCGDMFGPELKQRIATSDKKLLLAFTAASLRTKDMWGVQDIPHWLNLLKVLARTQSDLETTLYSPTFVLYLVDNIRQYADAGEKDPSDSQSAEVGILSQSIRLLLNLCIVDKDRIHQAFGCTPQPKGFGFFAGPKTASKETTTIDANSYPSLRPLIESLRHIVNTRQEPDALFLFVRIIMFVLVRAPLASYGIKYCQLYESLVQTFLRVSGSQQVGVELRDSASTASSSSSSFSSATSSSSSSDPVSNIKLALELVRLLVNLAMMDDELPSCASHLTQEANQQSLYNQYLQRLTALLAYGVIVPEEVLEGYKGDPIAQTSIGKLMSKDTTPKETTAVDDAAISIEQVKLSEDATDSSSTPSTTPSSSSTSSSSSNAVSSQPASSQPTASFTPVERQQTKLILERMSSESDDAKLSLLTELRDAISHLMIGADGESAKELLEADGCRAFHGMIQLLHRALILAGANKKESETLLSPILSSLSKLVKSSPILRSHAKRCIFLDLATPPTTTQDGKPYKKQDGSNYSMTPAGAVSEKITDPDPLSLKSLILQWIITLNFNLKQTVSEFLYLVCNEETSEYIRLLGFGNAVGLLAEKGLPGFAGLTSKAINMQDIMKSGKKL